MKSVCLKIVLVAVIAVCVCGTSHRRIGKDLSQVRASLVARRGNGMDVDFQPHPLPCSFFITESIDAEQTGSSDVQVNRYYGLGNIFKLSVDDPMQDAVQEIIVRADQKLKDPNTDKVFVAYYTGVNFIPDGINNEMLEEAAGVEEMHDLIDDFEREWSFQNVTNSTYHGKPCQMFYAYDLDNDLDIYFFADMDNYILGMNFTCPHEYFEEHVVYQYKWEFPMEDFVLNKTLFGSCNDTRAFVAPKKNPCKKSP